MTITEARRNVGRDVIFTDSSGNEKRGEIVMIVEPWVRVRYEGSMTAKSTAPKQLELA